MPGLATAESTHKSNSDQEPNLPASDNDNDHKNKTDSRSEEGECNESSCDDSENDVKQREEEKVRHPPLPAGPPPQSSSDQPHSTEDDGWEPHWDHGVGGYYFYNRLSRKSQWTNPRVPNASAPPGTRNRPPPLPPGTLPPSSNVTATTTSTSDMAPGTSSSQPPLPKGDPSSGHERSPPQTGGYNPAIHGNFDPNADYAKLYIEPDPYAGPPGATSTNTAGNNETLENYTAAGIFNRFTGKWQAQSINPDNHNDENKSRRQMNAFFDVDAAMNAHSGRSLKAERAGKRLSKQELKAFKEKRKERKEEKRRAWLRD